MIIVGEIIPLRITEKTLPWGQHHNLIGHLRLLLYTPLNAQSSLVTEVHENDGHGLVATYWYSAHILNTRAKQAIFGDLFKIKTRCFNFVFTLSFGFKLKILSARN